MSVSCHLLFTHSPDIRLPPFKGCAFSERRQKDLEKRKYYGRKIKRTKNLYRRRKTAGQKVFGTVMLVIAASAIAFLGFCVGKPLLDYLGSIGTDSPAQEWTPAASYMQRQGEPERTGDVAAETDYGVPAVDHAEPETASSVSAEAAAVTEPPVTAVPEQTTTAPLLIPVSDGTLISTEVPSAALANRSSLAAVVTKAKNSGYNSAVIQLKDENGNFRYRSTIPGVAGSDLVTGTMTLDEIMSVFAENGVVPVVKLAVLRDEEGCALFTDMSYKCLDDPSVSWLEAGQRRWANPESDSLREYFAKVITEITEAGFQEIILTDVMFPDFQPYDTEWIPAKYFAADRYKMLYNVVRAGSIIEMKASDVIGETYGRSAEVLNDVSMLHDNSVALVISREDLPTEAGYPADAKTLAETVLAQAAKKTFGLNVIPVIDGAGFDDSEKSKIVSVLSELGYESYIVVQ